jgi:hypothetical protein
VGRVGAAGGGVITGCSGCLCHFQLLTICKQLTCTLAIQPLFNTARVESDRLICLSVFIECPFVSSVRFTFLLTRVATYAIMYIYGGDHFA